MLLCAFLNVYAPPFLVDPLTKSVAELLLSFSLGISTSYRLMREQAYSSSSYTGEQINSSKHLLINIRSRRLGHIGACSHFSARGRQGQCSPPHGGATQARAVAPSRKRLGRGCCPPAEAPRPGRSVKPLGKGRWRVRIVAFSKTTQNYAHRPTALRVYSPIGPKPF
jgi:hypothetical protein